MGSQQRGCHDWSQYRAVCHCSLFQTTDGCSKGCRSVLAKRVSRLTDEWATTLKKNSRKFPHSALRRLYPEDEYRHSDRNSRMGGEKDSFHDQSKGTSTPSDPDNIQSAETDEVLPTFPNQDSSGASVRNRRTGTARHADGHRSLLPAALSRAINDKHQRGTRWAMPFVWSNDLPRAILEMAVQALHYLLM